MFLNLEKSIILPFVISYIEIRPVLKPQTNKLFQITKQVHNLLKVIFKLILKKKYKNKI